MVALLCFVLKQCRERQALFNTVPAAYRLIETNPHRQATIKIADTKFALSFQAP